MHCQLTFNNANKRPFQSIHLLFNVHFTFNLFVDLQLFAFTYCCLTNNSGRKQLNIQLKNLDVKLTFSVRFTKNKLTQQLNEDKHP